MATLAGDGAADQRVQAFAERRLGVAPVAEPQQATPAPTGSRSHARRGLAVEGEYRGQGAAAVLRREGYHPTRAQDSMGPWDVIGVRVADGSGPAVRLVQVKRRAAFSPSVLNEAVRALLSVPVAATARREAWLWLDGAGWVVRLWLGADGAVSGGDGRRFEEVKAAVEKSLARERDTRQQTPTQRTTFLERLRQ